MKHRFLQKALVLGLLVGSPLTATLCAAGYSHSQNAISTEAGNIDFYFTNYVKYPGAFHKITQFLFNDSIFEVENGSRWSVSKIDLIKGWDKSHHLTITQNHAVLSTYRYALVNLDLKLAVPISLVREPTPNSKDIYYVTKIDRINDILGLNDGKQWIIHSSDRNLLSKIAENDRIIVGANTDDSKDKSPYVLIDTANNNFVRASLYNE